jgi:integration host factor subunit beta
MGTVTKKDLIDKIAQTTGQKRLIVKRTVQRFLEQVIIELGKGNRLEFRDFGVFETKQRAARTAQNPKTLQRVEVPAKRTVKFKVGRMMKQGLDDPDSIVAAIAAAMGEEDEEDAPPPRSRAVSSNGRARHR